MADLEEGMGVATAVAATAVAAATAMATAAAAATGVVAAVAEVAAAEGWAERVDCCGNLRHRTPGLGVGGPYIAQCTL